MIQTKEVIKTSFQKYSEYKDSGVDWLGEIPKSWSLLSNKHIFKLKKNLVGKRSSEYTLLSLTLNGIIVRNLEDGGKFPAEFDTYQEVKKDDFVFCLFDVEETPRCVGLSKHEGMITGAYTVLECNSKFDNRFLYYFYLNLDSDKRMSPLYTGLRNTISKDNFFALKTFVPPLPEQTAIANFIDDKTTKIDQAIAQKEKMIALLKERKQIIIQNAVTKGLDPNVKMKDSGVEWIGEIPEHWEVKRLKYVCKINTEALPDNTPSNFRFNYVDIGSVSFENGIEKTESFNFKNAPSRARRLAQKGDTIISTVRTYLKAIDFVSEEKANLIYSTGFAVLTPTNILDIFLYHFVRSNAFTEQVTVDSKGMSYPAINSTDLSRLSLAIPPIEEQNEIVLKIKSKSIKIDKIVIQQQTQIEKLKEYKATLIDSAVTGKIKVC